MFEVCSSWDRMHSQCQSPIQARWSFKVRLAFPMACQDLCPASLSVRMRCCCIPNPVVLLVSCFTNGNLLFLNQFRWPTLIAPALLKSSRPPRFHILQEKLTLSQEILFCPVTWRNYQTKSRRWRTKLGPCTAKAQLYQPNP